MASGLHEHNSGPELPEGPRQPDAKRAHTVQQDEGQVRQHSRNSWHMPFAGPVQHVSSRHTLVNVQLVCSTLLLPGAAAGIHATGHGGPPAGRYGSRGSRNSRRSRPAPYTCWQSDRGHWWRHQQRQPACQARPGPATGQQEQDQQNRQLPHPPCHAHQPRRGAQAWQQCTWALDTRHTWACSTSSTMSAPMVMLLWALHCVLHSPHSSIL
jgi:hypothetical protein